MVNNRVDRRFLDNTALRAVIERPQLHRLINSFYELALPPAQPITTPITLVVGLGRTSASALEATTLGENYGFHRPVWEILQLRRLESERAALAAEPGYVSTTP